MWSRWQIGILAFLTAVLLLDIVLYGHNMSDGSMFGELKKYKDRTFYEKHPNFEFDTLYEKSMYQIAAVLVTDISDVQDFCYYNFLD